MYETLKEILTTKNDQRLKEFVENANEDKVFEMVLSKLNCSNRIVVLDAVLRGLSGKNSQLKKFKFTVRILKELQGSNRLISSEIQEVIDRIITDFPTYETQDLVKLLDSCINSISENSDINMSWSSIIPVILEILEDNDYINHKGIEVHALEFKSVIINSICNINWDNDVLIPLAKMFGDINIVEKSNHEIVFRKLCEKLLDMPMHEIPPLVFQLSKLCCKQNVKLLLETLKVYFEDQYTIAISSEEKDSIENIGISLENVQASEGTVLYHIYQAVQMDHEIFKDFIKFIKTVLAAPEYILNPFILGVLLSISDIFEDQIYEIIKSAILKKLDNEVSCNNSAWLRQNSIENWDLMAVINQVIRDSIKNRHLVVKGLINLVFSLLLTGENSVCKIGISILKSLIKKRHDTGVTVLQMLTEKIIFGGSQIKQYADCLSFMCTKLTMIVMDCQVWIVSLLDHLLLIPGDLAISVLYAIIPLIRISHTVRDNLILILRKALYRTGTATRRMAVTGLLEVLKYVKPNSCNSLSQCMNTSSDISAFNNSNIILTQATIERSHSQFKTIANNVSLYKDIIGILKKCFTHENEVRAQFYKGIHTSLLNNVEASISILETLFFHLQMYYEEDENVTLPLKLELCCELRGIEVVVIEPIAELLFIIQKLYNNFGFQMKGSNEILNILESICTRMAKIELEHLNLDEFVDLTDNVPKEQTKLQNLKLCIMIYDASISYKINLWSTESNDVAQGINALLKARNNLINFTKRAAKPKKGTGKNKKDANNTTFKKFGRPTTIKLPSSILDLETILRALSLLYLESVSWATEDQITFLRQRENFKLYILQSLAEIIQHTKTLNERDLTNPKNDSIKQYYEIGTILYKYAIINAEEYPDIDPQISLLIYECFKNLSELMCSSGSVNLSKFICIICDLNTNTDFGIQLFTVVISLKKRLEIVFKEEQEDIIYKKKKIMVLIETINCLVRKLDFTKNETKKIVECINELHQLEFNDTSVAMTILQLILWLEECTTDYGDLLNDMSQELCEKIGSINKMDSTIEEKFKILKNETLVQAYTVLNNQLKEKLHNATLLLTRIKADQAINNLTTRDIIKEKERNLCRQLSYIIQILYTLTNTKVEPGQCSDLTFKNLFSLYNLLSILTKYFYNKSSAQNPAFQSSRFIQAVQLAGKPLKLAFYNFITHTDESQNEKMSIKKSDTQLQRNKILKETKIIPRVVYAIEQFSKHILLLSKKTGIPLESYIKHSITRDFKIKNNELSEALEQMDVSLLNTQGDVNTSVDTSTPVDASTSTDNNDREIMESSRSDTDESDNDTSPTNRKRRKYQ